MNARVMKKSSSSVGSHDTLLLIARLMCQLVTTMGEPGHINNNCQKPKKAYSGGKVFALAGSQTTSFDRLTQGTCYVHNIPLITFIDIGATHSFIFTDCVKRLGLVVSTLSSGLVIDTN